MNVTTPAPSPDTYTDCLTLNRTQIPFNVLCGASAVHYFVVLFIFWDYNKKNESESC